MQKDCVSDDVITSDVTIIVERRVWVVPVVEYNIGFQQTKGGPAEQVFEDQSGAFS